MVGGRLVGHPVEDDLETGFVGRGKKMVKIFHRAELRIDPAVVGNGIIRAERALAALGADFVHRHQPQHIHPQVLEPGQLGLDAGEGSLRRELADIHFVNDGIIGPFWMGGDLGFLAAGSDQHGQQRNNGFFHIAY